MYVCMVCVCAVCMPTHMCGVCILCVCVCMFGDPIHLPRVVHDTLSVPIPLKKISLNILLHMASGANTTEDAGFPWKCLEKALKLRVFL